MKMCNKTGSFKKPMFDNKIYDVNGDLLTLTTHFTVVAPSEITGASVVSSNVINIGVHTLVPGDDIYVTGSDGIKRYNTVVNIGTETIEIRDNVKPSKSTTVNIGIDFYTVTMILTESDGLFYFSDNEALVICDTYLNLYVTYTELYTEWNGTSRDVVMNSLNTRALESVLADFSFLPTFYKKIDISQIKQLIILKMLSMIMSGDNRVAAKTDYTAFLKDMSLIVTRDSDTGEASPDITDDNVDLSVNYTIEYGG